MLEKFKKRRELSKITTEYFIPPKIQGKANEKGKLDLADFARRFLDLQYSTVYSDVESITKNLSGALLDVGCGTQPFRRLLSNKLTYLGIDHKNAGTDFGFIQPETIYYDGEVWPVDNGSIDFCLCTEVMEHVLNTEKFLAEARRILKNDGCLFLTIPFAARWHFIPHDYWRFTPSSLNHVLLKSGFKNISVFARGNPVTVACYKFIGLIFPIYISQGRHGKLRQAITRIILLPLLAWVPLAALIGHISLAWDWGDDCLGYTAVATKG